MLTWLLLQCNYTEGGQRDCSEHTEKIVPCDIYAPTGKQWREIKLTMGDVYLKLQCKDPTNDINSYRNLHADDCIDFDWSDHGQHAVLWYRLLLLTVGVCCDLCTRIHRGTLPTTTRQCWCGFRRRGARGTRLIGTQRKTSLWSSKH